MKNGTIFILSILLIQMLLVATSINANTIISDIGHTAKSADQRLELVQQFSPPTITDTGEFLNIHIKETNSFDAKTGEPILPLYQKTFEFPLGTRITEIKGTYSEIKKIDISKKINFASKPYPSIEDNTLKIEKNEQIYLNDSLYPKSWYSYKLVGGLNRNGNHTTFLTIQIHPVRYNPVTDTVHYIDFIKLELCYKEPLKQIFSADEYNLLIISYNLYKPLLKPLVQHKENLNITTKLVTLKEIYTGVYFSATGKDKPEQIKYFIKNAIEAWGITYVLLVGNFRKVPIIHTHLETDTGGTYEELYFASDLYYADVYNSDGNFSSWDTNNNGIYGEWPDPGSMTDKLDLAPDVYLGRLACMFASEVKSVVKKIIEYEENASGSEWFNRMIVCGGDTFDKKDEGGTDYDEGEVAAEEALAYMSAFKPVKLYASLDNLITENIHNETNKGAGFLYFVGHGNPKTWGTHKNGDYINWTGGWQNKNILTLTNNGMYPILMVGGCHNSEYDVTPLNLIKGLLTERIRYFLYGSDYFGSYYLYNWVLECWSWVFVKHPDGGAIASMGSVGYGGVDIGDSNGNDIPDCIEGLDGWFETQFFKIYNEGNIDILGATYSQVVTDYVNTFPVYTNRYDCKIVETHVLLGDPTLKIGGYD